MSKIHFKTKLFKIGTWTIMELPKSASAELPSRGLCMVEGSMNDTPFLSALEPDGKGSHWLRVDSSLSKAAQVKAGDTVTVTIEPIETWPEPTLPSDLKQALTADPQVQALWAEVTTKARWDWIRWIRSTKNPETRKIRIEKTFSKLKGGMRRPCCFNQSMCTEPEVSSGGVLLSQ